MNEQQIREQMVKTGKRLLICDLNHATAGNISVRLNKNEVLISPTDYDLSEMEASDIVKINMEGEVIGTSPAPSTEYKLHLMVYKLREDVNAVIHTHSPYMTAFAVCNKSFEKRTLPEFVNTVSSLPLVAYEVPHTKELAESITEAAKDHNSLLLANHGSLTMGKTLLNAQYTLEISEFACKVSVLAKLIGEEQTLTVTKE